LRAGPRLTPTWFSPGGCGRGAGPRWRRWGPDRARRLRRVERPDPVRRERCSIGARAVKSALPSSPEARLLIVVDHWDEAAFACLSPTSPAALLPLGSIPPLQRPAARALLEERGIETIAVHE